MFGTKIKIKKYALTEPTITLSRGEHRFIDERSPSGYHC